MSEKKDIVFCTGGGCTAKLGAGVLSRILEKLPRGEKDPNLLVGYDSRDDAAVYQVTEELALVQTVDFFPPMVDDPYIFGQVAAANALSDVYAMGGEVKTALNLVCFPESMDLNVLGQILQGGAEKVAEAGGILAGGHSIADTGVKYGLSVTGLVNPKKLYANDAGQPGDRLILTKALGVGLICSANRVGEVTKEQMKDWKGHWENNEKGWWYVNRDGSYPVNNWQQIDSLWYFFDEEGYMKTGWIHWNEKDYFCDESGAMLVNTVTPDGASVGIALSNNSVCTRYPARKV